MRALRARPEAEIDAFEAVLWYESERTGLGGEFLGAVREVFGHVESQSCTSTVIPERGSNEGDWCRPSNQRLQRPAAAGTLTRATSTIEFGRSFVESVRIPSV